MPELPIGFRTPPRAISPESAAIARESVRIAGRSGWIRVRSSWVQAVRYNQDRGTFDVLIDGKEYPDYPDMTMPKFQGLLRTKSVGKWMWANYPPQGKRRRYGR